jgi:hypothetical protein
MLTPMALGSPFLEVLVVRLRGRAFDIGIEIGCGGQ